MGYNGHTTTREAEIMLNSPSPKIDVVASAPIGRYSILVGSNTYQGAHKAGRGWCVALCGPLGGGRDAYQVVASFPTEGAARTYANRVWTYAKAEGMPGWANCTRLVPVV